MSQLLLDTSLAVPDDVIFRELDGEAILLNLATGMYFGLDQVGTRLWALITESGSLRNCASSQMPGTIRIVVHQIVQVEHWVLGQHERGQRLQVGFRDRFADLDPLQGFIRLE